MFFEFDPNKSAETKRNRGIDFVEAQEIWNDENAITAKAKTVDGEYRYRRTGSFKGRIWTAIYTYRGETIRIMSVRRAHTDEQTIYYGG